jgi:ABC-type cobalamin transport system ATPase subunit
LKGSFATVAVSSVLAPVSTDGAAGEILTAIVPAANTVSAALADLLASATAVAFNVRSGGTGSVLGAV